MPRNFPVPQNIRTTQVSGADIRAMNSSTGTESTATVASLGLGAAGQGYMRPEQTWTANGAVLAVGTAMGWGWVMDAGLDSDDPTTVAAGNIDFIIRHVRDGGLGTADRNITWTVIVFRRTAAGVVAAELGRNSGSAIVTTAQANLTISVAIAASALGADDRLYVEVHANVPSALGSTAWRMVSNSANACRISAAPTYTTQFARGLGDSSTTADAVTRAAAVARALADSPAVADALARTKSMVRPLADAAGVSDSLARTGTFARALGDAAGAVDSLARGWTGSRGLDDAASAVDSLARTGTFGRGLADSPAVTDTLARVLTLPRPLADSPAVADVLARAWSGSRSLADLATVVDTLGRVLILGRPLYDAIGGFLDWPIQQATREIRGHVVEMGSHDPVGGATVWLIRDQELAPVASTTSAADGLYVFPRDRFDPYTYHVYAFKDGAPPVQCVTKRGLAPTAV